MLFKNTVFKRETDQNFPEMPSCDAKPIKDFRKCLPATRNRSKLSGNAKLRREMGKILRKTPFRDGKWEKFSEKRFPAAGNGENSSENGFPRREGA